MYSTRLVKETNNTADGEVAEVFTKEIDAEIIENEERYDGYYCVATTLN